jgi:hypothetical protein
MAGLLPSKIGQLTQLTFFHLCSNKLVGLPPDIGLLTALTVLALTENEFIGQVPWGYFNLTALEAIYLNDNNLKGNLNGVFFGSLPIEVLWSNCSGNPPEISCPCCTHGVVKLPVIPALKGCFLCLRKMVQLITQFVINKLSQGQKILLPLATT